MDNSTPENIFRSMRSVEQRRVHGQFFTPEPTARLMARWIADGYPRTVLDPACGPGALIRAISAVLPASEITAYDTDEDALRLARQYMLPGMNAEYIQGDFLTCKTELYDAVIANPPYIRHQTANYSDELFEEAGRSFSVRVPRTSNAYMLFLLKCLGCLNPGGRMCFLIPAEWSNANFSRTIKKILLEKGLIERMIYFPDRADVFGDALTTACILFISTGNYGSVPVHVVTQPEHAELSSLRDIEKNVPARFFTREELQADNWNTLFRGEQRMPEGWVALSDLARVRRGTVTGANRFFHLSLQEAVKHKIRTCSLVPCAGRYASSVRFGKNELEMLQRTGKSRLLVLNDTPDEYEKNYIALGEKAGLNLRHILSRRKPWYSMEYVPAAPIWGGVFSRGTPKFILNDAGARNLTTWHGIYPHEQNPIFHAALAVVLNTSGVSVIAGERMRVYGGGLRKFEPSDLAGIPVPDIRMCNPETIALLASLCNEKGKQPAQELLCTLFPELPGG